ncbi:MAG: hypothetical protein RJA99_1226 [Pseudomonadota bacterium]|jgi:hypothetical protein
MLDADRGLNPEEAALWFALIHLLEDSKFSDDASDADRERAARDNERKRQLRKEVLDRYRDGRLYVFEAANVMGWADPTLKDTIADTMVRHAHIPPDRPEHLRLCDRLTLAPLVAGERGARINVVSMVDFADLLLWAQRIRLKPAALAGLREWARSIHRASEESLEAMGLALPPEDASEKRLARPAPAPTRWTIEDAAHLIGEQRGLPEAQVKTLVERMWTAAQNGDLRVRDRAHDTTIPKAELTRVRWFYEFVSRQDVNDWLEKADANWRWEEEPEKDSPSPLPVTKSRPVSRQAWQEERLVETLVALGFNPEELPVHKQGTRNGPRAQCRARVKEVDGDDRWTPKVFDKAWERCRAAGTIRDAP